jgi:excinuclease ABC subunit B
VKSVRDILEISGSVDDAPKSEKAGKVRMTRREREEAIEKLEKQMREAARMLEFEYAAVLRDRLIRLRGEKQE